MSAAHTHTVPHNRIATTHRGDAQAAAPRSGLARGVLSSSLTRPAHFQIGGQP